MYKECRHVFSDGSRCHAAALKDLPYCCQHDRIHRALLRQRSSSKARLDLPAIEDRASIMMALSQVLCALAAGRIDGTNAGRLIYCLQVASQFTPITHRLPSDEQVESITLTKDGDELAPEFIKCFKNDDCDTCPYRDECGDEESEEEAEEAGEEDEDADGDEEQVAGAAA